MSETAIRVEDLSKRYIIGHRRDSKDGLRHRVETLFRSPWRWIRNRRQEKRVEREEFWALKDVAFEVKQGEAVAIVGRNGAGKSTLLKVLSRITDPTSGRIALKGRVASLLEVGTGFHQELTGRENIFLNGAILGMTRAEIKRKFDEIVAFSEVERFLDTPVKRYSSGMYVRLAFAVAAHLEPEILIVDEVLAVGDAQFQKKCLGKMGQVAKGGRTVLFVSHNLAAVQALCSKAVYLQSGRVIDNGDVAPVVSRYVSDSSAYVSRRLVEPLSLGASFKLIAIQFTPAAVESGHAIEFSLKFFTVKGVSLRELSLLVNSASGGRVALIDLRSLGLPIDLPPAVEWSISGQVSCLPLVEGDYSVGLTVNTGEFWENVFDLAEFTVIAKSKSNGYAPYPVIYRGFVELECSASHSSSQ